MSEEVLIWTIFIFGVAVVEVAINELLEAQLAVAVCIHSQECVLCPRRLRTPRWQTVSCVRPPASSRQS